MGMLFILTQMVMRHMTNKGFTLIDILVVLFIVSSLSLVTISKYSAPDFLYIYLTNDILRDHVNSLVNKRESLVNEYGYYFNENGNINKAQTIHLKNKDIILHLGNGYLVYE